MRCLFRTAHWTIWVVAFGLALAMGPIFGQDEKPATNQEQPAETEISFTIPETDDTSALLEFIERLMSYRPTTEAQAVLHADHAPTAIKDAAKKILALEKDPTSEAATKARLALMHMSILEFDKLSENEQQKVFEDVQDYVTKKEKPSLMELGLGVRLSQAMESVKHPSAGKAYEVFGTLLSKDENPNVAQVGEQLLMSARRLGLVGSTFALKGTTLEGKDFDLESLKGKVVLVDFWATWCGPCVEEIPNVKAQYAKYHEKGFEVVGISLDKDRASLDRFSEQITLPWTILHDENGPHPAAKECGVMSIPFMVLVDREGKVISIEARGEELARLLASQFPDDTPKP